jgi:hypothetical protein
MPDKKPAKPAAPAGHVLHDRLTPKETRVLAAKRKPARSRKRPAKG